MCEILGYPKHLQAIKMDKTTMCITIYFVKYLAMFIDILITYFNIFLINYTHVYTKVCLHITIHGSIFYFRQASKMRKK